MTDLTPAEQAAVDAMGALCVPPGDIEEVAPDVVAAVRGAAMTDYPTPERVRRMMELRAYVMELGLDPNDVIEIAEVQDYSNATGTTFRITMRDGKVIQDDGPWFLDPDQKEAALGAAERLEQIWAQLHEMPVFRPKEWASPTAAEEQP